MKQKYGPGLALLIALFLYSGLGAEDRYVKTPLQVGGLRGNLLIMHGMQDSNVLFQDTVQIVQKLVEAGKYFDLMVYPREDHMFTATASAWPDVFKRLADRLKGKILFVNGTNDWATLPDTYRMIEAFIRIGKPYDLVILPEQGHGPTGKSMDYFIDSAKRYFLANLPPEGD